MNRIKLKVGDKISLFSYDGDKMSRPVEITEIKDTGLIRCKCLIRSSPASPVYRSYYKSKIGKVSYLKLD